MKRRLTHVTLATAALILLTGAYGGCHRPHDSGEMATWLEERATDRVTDVLEDVDASPEQQEKIVQATRRVVQEGIVLHGVGKETKELLRSEWAAATPDRNRMHRLIDRRVDDLRRVLHVAADAFAETHQTLTAEQRSEVLDEL